MADIFGVKFKMFSVLHMLFLIVSKEIQTGGSAGHDPCEDALAALDVVLHRLQTCK